MPEPEDERPVTTAPQPALPRVIGVLNILVALGLLMCGSGLAWAIVPFLRENSPLQLEPGSTEQVVVQARIQTLADLKDRISTTSDAATRQRLTIVREALAKLPEPLVGNVDFALVNRDLPALSRYLWFDTVTAPLLNLLLLIAGLGLLRLKEWARRLAVWVAWAKVARLIVMNGYLGLIVVPAMGRVMEQLLRSDAVRTMAEVAATDAALQQARAGAPAPTLAPADLVAMLQAFGHGYALTALALGLIYPAIVLIVLTRRGARAACLARGRDPASRITAGPIPPFDAAGPSAG